MKHRYITVKIWFETLQTLRRIHAETGNSLVSILDALVTAELDRVTKKKDYE